MRRVPVVPVLLLLLARSLVAAAGGSDDAAELPLLPFDDEGSFAMSGGTALRERSATVEWSLPSYTKSAQLHVLPSLVTPELAASIRQTLDAARVNTDPDSVDSLPTFEFPLESHNQPNLLDTDSRNGEVRAALRDLTAAPIEEALLPYVREKYSCPRCRVCTSMLRRYLPGERRRHPAHFDTQAYVTVVVSLSAFGQDFSGGLYVRRGGSGAGGEGKGDAYLPLGLGDGVAHQFDVEHGVEVTGGGNRYSWIVWLQDEDVCAPGGKPAWHEARAAAGDPVSMYNLGNTMTSDPMDGEAVANAHGWFVKAAEGGYAAAMYSAGVMHVQGPPTVEQNPQKGLVWLEKAAALGDLHAMYNTGFMLTQGLGGEDRMRDGLEFFKRAADQGDAKSAWALAAMYMGQGAAMGIEADAEQADVWMAQASELGHAEATYRVGKALLKKAALPAAAEPKGRRGRRKKQKAKSDDKGLIFRASDEEFKEAFAVIKKAAAWGHEEGQGVQSITKERRFSIEG